MNRKTYYTLSFTWGLPMSIIGLLVALALMVTGHKPDRFGFAWCFEVGKGWGGLDLGLIILCGKNSSNVLKAHEYGHSIQNTKYGFAMVFLTLASAARYWYYTVVEDWWGKKLPPYDSWWLEAQATKIGTDQIINTNM